jgi:hypothetical protein
MGEVIRIDFRKKKKRGPKAPQVAAGTCFDRAVFQGGTTFKPIGQIADRVVRQLARK